MRLKLYVYNHFLTVNQDCVECALTPCENREIIFRTSWKKKTAHKTGEISSLARPRLFIFHPRGRAARNHGTPRGSDGRAAMAACSFIPDLHWTTNRF